MNDLTKRFGNELGTHKIRIQSQCSHDSVGLAGTHQDPVGFGTSTVGDQNGHGIPPQSCRVDGDMEAYSRIDHSPFKVQNSIFNV